MRVVKKDKAAAAELLEELAGQRCEYELIEASLKLTERVMVATIEDALGAGATWAQIGAALNKERSTLYRWYQVRKR